jgi:hypothetical protein
MDHGLPSRCDQPAPGAPPTSPSMSILSIQGSRTPCPAPRDRRHAPTGPPAQIPARRKDGPLGARVAPASEGAPFIFGHPRDTAALASRACPLQVALRPPDQPPKADTGGSTTPRLASGHREPDLGLPADPRRAKRVGAQISATSIRRILTTKYRPPPKRETWRQFMQAQASSIIAL